MHRDIAKKTKVKRLKRERKKQSRLYYSLIEWSSQALSVRFSFCCLYIYWFSADCCFHTIDFCDRRRFQVLIFVSDPIRLRRWKWNCFLLCIQESWMTPAFYTLCGTTLTYDCADMTVCAMLLMLFVLQLVGNFCVFFLSFFYRFTL